MLGEIASTRSFISCFRHLLTLFSTRVNKNKTRGHDNGHYGPLTGEDVRGP